MGDFPLELFPMAEILTTTWISLILLLIWHSFRSQRPFSREVAAISICNSMTNDPKKSGSSGACCGKRMAAKVNWQAMHPLSALIYALPMLFLGWNHSTTLLSSSSDLHAATCWHAKLRHQQLKEFLWSNSARATCQNNIIAEVSWTTRICPFLLEKPVVAVVDAGISFASSLSSCIVVAANWWRVWKNNAQHN